MGKINDIDINEKRLKWSKFLVVGVLLLLAFSIAFRMYYNNRESERYERHLELLTNGNISNDMRKALSNVSLTSNSRDIYMRDGELIIENKFTDSNVFLMKDFFFNPRNGNITIFGLREDENRSFVFNFRLLPSNEKFQSKIAFDGREYDIIYNDIDIEKDYDPILDIIDFNNDGYFDMEMYEKFQERYMNENDRPMEHEDE